MRFRAPRLAAVAALVAPACVFVTPDEIAAHDALVLVDGRWSGDCAVVDPYDGAYALDLRLAEAAHARLTGEVAVVPAGGYDEGVEYTADVRGERRGDRVELDFAVELGSTWVDVALDLERRRPDELVGEGQLSAELTGGVLTLGLDCALARRR